MKRKVYESPEIALIKFNFAEILSSPQMDSSGEDVIGDGGGRDPGNDLV